MDMSNRYFLFERKVLSFAGLWYTQTYKERLLRYYIMGFIALYNISGEMCQIASLDLDLRTAVRCLQVFVPAVCASTIYYSAVLHFMTIQKIYNHIEQDWQRLTDDTERKIMQEHNLPCKRFTLLLTLTFYLYVIISISPSLLRIILSTKEVRSDIDHYPIISCFDYFLDQETYYYPIVTYQIIITFIFVTLSICFFSAYFSFAQHVCARLSIIKYQIYCSFVSNNLKDGILTEPVNLSHRVIDIVQHLARITEFNSLLNTLCEVIFIVQIFLAFVFLIIDFLCLFQIPDLIDAKENGKDVIELVIFIFGTLWVIYIGCYTGQKIMDCSMDVYIEVCLVPLHKISVKTQKLLLTTLMISSKPCIISIGKVFIASNEFFSSLLRSSLSFAIILRSLQNI